MTYLFKLVQLSWKDTYTIKHLKHLSDILGIYFLIRIKLSMKNVFLRVQ